MRKEKILVLDDDPLVNLSCRKFLGAEGYNVSTVERGGDALKKLDEEAFDLFIVDIKLPDMNGMVVLKETKTAHPEVDVVVITGDPALQEAKESIKLGAFEYMEKPFTPESMISVTKKIFDKRGWTLIKNLTDEFRDHIIALNDSENSVRYNEEGIWSRPLKEDFWEVGCDIKYWFPSGQLLYIDFPEGLTNIAAGESFAKVLTSTGEVHELISPVSGTVKEINERANTVIASIVPEHSDGGGLLWLVRITETK